MVHVNNSLVFDCFAEDLLAVVFFGDVDDGRHEVEDCGVAVFEVGQVVRQVGHLVLLVEEGLGGRVLDLGVGDVQVLEDHAQDVAFAAQLPVPEHQGFVLHQGVVRIINKYRNRRDRYLIIIN